MLETTLAALPVIAKSWQALVGYIFAIAAFTVITLKVRRNRNVLKRIEKIPAADRARVLEMEMGAAYLARGLSPKDFLEHERMRLTFYIIVTVAALVLVLVASTVGLAFAIVFQSQKTVPAPLSPQLTNQIDKLPTVQATTVKEIVTLQKQQETTPPDSIKGQILNKVIDGKAQELIKASPPPPTVPGLPAPGIPDNAAIRDVLKSLNLKTSFIS